MLRPHGFRFSLLCILITIGNLLKAIPCTGPVSIWEQVVAVVQADLPLGKRLEKLNQYERVFLQCKYPLDSVYARILHEQGRCHRGLGEIDQAISLTRKAIAINATGKPDAHRANCINGYFNLLLIYRDLRDEENMMESYEKLSYYSRDHPERRVLAARGANNVAYYCNEKGDFQNSIEYARLGIENAREAGDRVFESEGLIMSGQAYIGLGNWTEARNQFVKAHTILKTEHDPETLALVLFQMARIEYENEHFDQSIRLVDQALKHLKPYVGVSIGAAGNYGSYLNLKGEAYRRKKLYNSALTCYQDAATVTDIKWNKASISSNAAKVYAAKGDYTKALAIMQESLQIPNADVTKNPAASFIKPISEKTILLELVTDKASIWLAWARHNSNSKTKLIHALNTFMLADTVVDLMRWEHSGLMTKIFWRRNMQNMYEQAIEACFLLGNVERAFYFLEKSRAALLSDQLNELNASQLISESDRRREQELRTNIEEYRVSLEDAEGKESAAVLHELLSSQRELDSLIRGMEKSNPLYYAYKYDNKVPSVSDLRGSILKDGQTFLSYFVGDSAVYGLAAGPGKTVLKQLDLQEYNLLTGAFQKLISDRNTQNSNFGEYLRVSSALYKLLIAPFEIPEGARIVISPDGSFLPFSALSRSDGRPDFLVNHYALSYTYSAVVLGKMQRKTTGSWFSPGFFGMAPVQFAPSLNQAALTGSDQVLHNIDRYFFRSRIATGQEASRKEFVNSSPGYRIVQLFTHASADSSGSIPTLYFADSTLRLNELSLPRKPLTELLILSACETGVGKNQRGEGVFSLARGFAALGIPSVLTTLWSVENEPVYQITQNLYDQISDDIPLDIALQNAQKQWLQTASRHGQLPYAWAGMVIVGNTEPVETGVPFRKVRLFGAFLLAAAVGIYMVRGRRISIRR